ncbi:pyruvate formate lyase family protein, partial [Escherichia coli]|uniref:pyruvate formate lyase family protein n=1 Tax=Escherichia coli TaxID=562 RepID=UPI0013F9B987
RLRKVMDLVLGAVSEHMCRVAAAARQVAATGIRESRRDEWFTIAENCDLSAHQPPLRVAHALQLCYFIHLLLQLESTGHSGSF